MYNTRQLQASWVARMQSLGDLYADGRFPNLKPGDTGFWVQKLQSVLIGAGYSNVEAPVLGQFGPKTEASVRQFQQDDGLPVTGMVDELTWSKLLLAPTSRPEEIAPSDKLISQQVVEGKPPVPDMLVVPSNAGIVPPAAAALTLAPLSVPGMAIRTSPVHQGFFEKNKWLLLGGGTLAALFLFWRGK